MEFTPEKWFAATGWVGAGDLQKPIVICRIEGYPYGRTEANAHLIAAAPEQHDALKRARITLADIQKRWTNIPAYASTDITAALNVIDAAIAKAGAL